MNTGDVVQSQLYKQKEHGRIINIISLDGANYYEIYFPESKETLTLEEKDIQKVSSPVESLRKGDYAPSQLLRLRIIAEKIDSLLYQDKLITANNFKIVPLPHQVLAVNSVLGQFMPRCLIADEVGLGKTIEAALIYEELKLRNMVKRILIISPAGLTVQWRDEMKTKFNEDFSILDRNTFRALRELHGNINVWTKFNRIITSLDFLKPKSIRDSASESQKKRIEEHNSSVTNDCINAGWDMVIFDEAHKLSKDSEGAETARYKLGKSLSDIAPIFLLLTATPHQGDSERFRHLLSLIDEYRFYSPETLVPENVKAVTVKNRKRSAVDFKGELIFKSRITSLVKIERDESDIEVELYNEVTEYISQYYRLASRENNFPFMFLLILYQRMVSSSSRAIYNSLNNRLQALIAVQQSLNSITQSTDMDDVSSLDGQEAYEELSGTNDNPALTRIAAIPSMIGKEIQVLTKCVTMAKKACSGRQDYKARKVIEIIHEICRRDNDPKAKILIFTEFISTQYYLGEILEGLGYKVSYLNGKMSLDQKIVAKQKFREDYQILISTDAGGEGINLQFCHLMINYDLPWNPMKIEQRIGRLDRIGQKKDVLVFNFVLNNTVEERVREVLNEKLDRIAFQFGEDKKADVLNALQDEFDFDRIFIDAIKEKEMMIPELEKLGDEIFNRAKEILEKQDFLLPFTEKIDNKKLQSSILENESQMVLSLVKGFAEYSNMELKEYTNRKKVYYTEQPLFNEKLKDAVFDKDMAIDNEGYDYINITHPLTASIIRELLRPESLTFNVEIEDSGFAIDGILFYYRIDFTNNQGFMRRHLVPIFIDDNLNYQEKISKWIESSDRYTIKKGMKPLSNDMIELALEMASTELNDKVKALFNETKLELIKRIDEERQKFDGYFRDKEKAINRIAIQNIRDAMLKELSQQRISQRIATDKKKNLVPGIKMMAAARVSFTK